MNQNPSSKEPDQRKQQEQQPPQQQKPAPAKDPSPPSDPFDEASWESFPASDPPARSVPKRDEKKKAG